MKIAIAIALAAAVLVASPLAATADQTPYNKRPIAWNGDYDKVYVTKKPVHGYSGPALNSFAPGGFIHCDYHRIPIRSCNSSGRCKAVAWELHQYCY
jgi:opacity protein-like surface antigen